MLLHYSINIYYISTSIIFRRSNIVMGLLVANHTEPIPQLTECPFFASYSYCRASIILQGPRYRLSSPGRLNHSWAIIDYCQILVSQHSTQCHYYTIALVRPSLHQGRITLLVRTWITHYLKLIGKLCCVILILPCQLFAAEHFKGKKTAFELNSNIAQSWWHCCWKSRRKN